MVDTNEAYKPSQHWILLVGLGSLVWARLKMVCLITILGLENNNWFSTLKSLSAAAKLPVISQSKLLSTRHRVNFTVLKIGRGMSPSQSQNVLIARNHLSQSPRVGKPLRASSPSKKTSRSPRQHGIPVKALAMTKSRLPIVESICADPSKWHIEQIFVDLEKHCRGKTDVKRCGAKISRYRHAMVVPTFTGIER